LNTRQLAEKIGILSTSIHARYCRNGDYFGLIPEKLPNGQLLWPENSVDILKESARTHGAVDKAKSAREAKRAAAEAAQLATTQADSGHGAGMIANRFPPFANGETLPAFGEV